MDHITTQLINLGVEGFRAEQLTETLNAWQASKTPAECWQACQRLLCQGQTSFPVHQFLYQTIYSNQFDQEGLTPAWFPSPEIIEKSNLQEFMQENGVHTIAEAHRWSLDNTNAFWTWIIDRLNIQFSKDYDNICDCSDGIEQPHWLAGAKLNIIDSCFQASPDATAIICENEQGRKKTLSYGELQASVDQFAACLTQHGFIAGDPIAIAMPMHWQATVLYLAIIKIGACVVAFPDSFSAKEMATRLQIANTKAVFTQDVIARNHKILPLYQKIVDAKAPKTIVIAQNNQLVVELREGDLAWTDFLKNTSDIKKEKTGQQTKFGSYACDPDDPINILFSSGTTGDPKAIPWDHTTPIKCASDAFFHQDIHPGDVLAWPMNLGWMMGPWLVFAALMNRATIALYDGVPTTRGFGEFIEKHHVTMLGLVPSLVKAWRASACMEDLDWSAIKVFSSTGECSNCDDMFYLMFLGRYKPIIEYCGGTEIGGAYISSTVLHACTPATFAMPTMGLDFLIIDENGDPSEEGEVALVPPSIGLSNRLLNRDHHQEYYTGMPKGEGGVVLRRHGDQARRLAKGYSRLLGRADDTMNLSGIKISSADIERALVDVPGVLETAAIGVNPKGGGPTQLVIYVVLTSEKPALKQALQAAIKTHLNPLFKIHEVVAIDSLPRTASNKVMRRVLREMYLSASP